MHVKLGALCAVVAIGAIAIADTARIAARIIDDETGRPVEGVSVIGSFRDDIGWRAWTESVRPDLDRQISDGEGLCRMSGRTNCGDASFWVKSVPAGYYKAGGHCSRFKEKNLLDVWQPDNLVVTIRLQRVEHPIPLFVKRVGDHINRSKVGYGDGTNTLFKYDLVAGDYLPPDGHGEVADLVVESRLTNLSSTNLYLQTMVFYDFTNAMSFPGEGNGVISSMTRATDGIRLRIAPETGYQTSRVAHCGKRKKSVPPNVRRERYSDADPNRCYYFRIRSKYDESGNLVGGYYGKIYGDFEIGCRLRYGGCSVEFLYYLNPTPLDRNLEWDMKTNLCPDPGNIGMRRP